MSVKVAVDEGRCCGAGQCVLIAPEVFDQRDEDGIVVALQSNPAAVCPASAITIDGDH